MPRVPASPTADKALAAALRRLRLQHEMTQESLAAATGITTNSYARIELGQASPAWVTVCSIIDALGVSLTELAAAVEAER